MDNILDLINEEISHKEFGPMMDSFVAFASNHLGIKSMPNIRYKDVNDDFSSFGGYSPNSKEIVLQTKGRHPMDALRTLAHELVHHKQNEDGELDGDVEEAGRTGSSCENRANSEAGVLMRHWGKKNPKMFESGALVESFLSEMALAKRKKLPVANRARYKALFYAGGPGSGKDYVAKQTGYGHGFTEINTDHAFEHLLGREGLSKKMPAEEEPRRTPVRARAKSLTKFKQTSLLSRGRGVIINTTGHDHEKIAKMKGELEKRGYDTKMVFVNTSNEVSRQRNIDRGKQGGRTVPEETRQEYWSKAQRSRGHYEKMFGPEHFHHVDNSMDANTASDDEKTTKQGEFTGLFKNIRGWATSKPENPVGRASVETEIAKRRNKPKRVEEPAAPVAKPRRTMANIVAPEVNAAAKGIGLKHWGSGYFGPRKKGPDGRPIITHRESGGKLTRVSPKKTPLIPQEPIKEDLRQWFDPKHPKGNWKRINSKGEVIGPCARGEGEGKPKCMSNEKRAKLTKKERASAVRSKREHDPNPERKGKPINVSNFGKGKLNEENKPTNPELWAKAKSMAKQKFDVYPCVPMDSRAITKDGLKTYEELVIGEEILTYNLKKDVLEWNPVTHLHFYENAPLKRIYKKTGFSIRATENHKWVVKTGEFYDKVSLVETKDIHKRMRLVTCAVLENNPNRILENWSKKDNWVSNILSWPQNMREVYLASSIVYDGHDVGGSTKITDRHTFGFSQKNDDHFWAALLAAYLNGYHVSFYEKTETISGASIIRNKSYHSTQNLIVEDDVSENVWCPTTDNQTWVMVQNGFITITGNSAYANGWASKWYKSKGGGWKSVNEDFDDYLKEVGDTPIVGDTLPGKQFRDHPFMSEGAGKKKKAKRKALAQEVYNGKTDTSLNVKPLPDNEGVGPMASLSASPSLVGGLGGVLNPYLGMPSNFTPYYGLSESIIAWATKEETLDAYIERYGDYAEEKLNEDAKDMIESGLKPKTLGQLKEAWGYRYGIEMGTVPATNQNKDEGIDEDSPAWQRKEGKNPEGGLNRKGVESYRRENPGSKLQTAVTTKPSKLKKGSKSWKRRKSFCARMSGMTGPMKDEKGRPTRKALSLRKWNCE